MKEAIALALEQARYPSVSTRVVTACLAIVHTCNIAGGPRKRRDPHPDEETRLAAVLSVLVKLREAELEIIKTATEIAEAMKGNR